MRKRLIRLMLWLVLLTTVCALGLVLPRLYNVLERRTYGELEHAAALYAEVFAQEGAAMLRALHARAPNLRVTLIDASGEVLYDSRVSDSEAMENHALREEVQEALQAGEGWSRRVSGSLGEHTYYYARSLDDGSVFRLAQQQRSVYGELADLLPSLLFIGLAVTALSFLVADGLTRRFMAPIRRLDLDHPDAQDAYEELVPLLARLVQQRRRIDEQRKAEEENAQKVAAITRYMSEGLMMVDMGGNVLSVNESAKALLRMRGEGVGRHYMALCRRLELHAALEKALAGEMAQTQMILDDRIYHLLANPVRVEGRVDGAIALFLDITERERAETTRREFSANVSHELKTPLTIVAGYAEMIQAGLSDVRDHQALAEKIHNEAMHLLSLIEDIIALSKLDETPAPILAEPVDLYALAKTVLERLEPVARDKGVALSLEGESALVLGTPAMLEEMLQNLVDNAIAYNKPGGRAGVRVLGGEQGPLVTVWDTGIGIARAHHSRVFERFYRVDKSRSRETGGTGLGLSIVKHCAQIHGASLRLTSEPGKGTDIAVRFPPQALPTEHGAEHEQ